MFNQDILLAVELGIDAIFIFVLAVGQIAFRCIDIEVADLAIAGLTDEADFFRSCYARKQDDWDDEGDGTKSKRVRSAACATEWPIVFQSVRKLLILGFKRR